MSALLDTNVLVRHFTGSPPEQAARATEFLALQADLWLVDLVVAETVYVLRSFYALSRAEVASLLRAAVGFPTVRVENASVLERALELFETTSLDYAEAYLVGVAEASGISDIASFDRSLDRVDTVTRIEP